MEVRAGFAAAAVAAAAAEALGMGSMVGGGARSRVKRFRPMAQISSQFFVPTSNPCTRQSHAMSHANSVMASRNEEHAAGSSCARSPSLLGR